MKGMVTMKGSEIIKFAMGEEMPDMAQVRDNCVKQTAPVKRRTSSPVFRLVSIAAVAAVVALCLNLIDIADTQTANTFSIQAHAFGQGENGSVDVQSGTINSITITADITEDEEIFTFSNVYQSLYFVVEGDNIKDVELFTDGDGDFKRTRYLTDNGEFVDSEHGLTIISENRLGKRFTLEDLGDLSDGYVLMAGIPGTVNEDTTMTIHVIATFTDGTTQSQVIVIDIHAGNINTFPEFDNNSQNRRRILR